MQILWVYLPANINSLHPSFELTVFQCFGISTRKRNLDSSVSSTKIVKKKSKNFANGRKTLATVKVQGMKKKHKTFHINCGKCGTYLLTYHKYGVGKGILRLYFANIAAPDDLVALLDLDYDKVGDVPNLCCSECGEVVGLPAISKGRRWVFRMRQGYFHRKLIK